MKRLFSFLMFIFPIIVNAYDAQIDGIYYNFKDGEAEVTSHNQYGGSYYNSVIIPSVVTFNGEVYPVTKIGKKAFYDSKLNSVTIPDGVITIEDYAFCGCPNLHEINIPNTVACIGNGVIENCSGLLNVYIGSGLTTIGKGTFSNCNNLSAVKVSDSNKVYDSRKDCNAIIETETNTLIAGCKTTVIPNSVTKIGNQAFYECKELNNISIPSSVICIGEQAFVRCLSLTNIYIPSSVESIESYAFCECSSLTSINIPEGINSIKDHTFHGCI